MPHVLTKTQARNKYIRCGKQLRLTEPDLKELSFNVSSFLTRPLVFIFLVLNSEERYELQKIFPGLTNVLVVHVSKALEGTDICCGGSLGDPKIMTKFKLAWLSFHEKISMFLWHYSIAQIMLTTTTISLQLAIRWDDPNPLKHLTLVTLCRMSPWAEQILVLPSDPHANSSSWHCNWKQISFLTYFSTVHEQGAERLTLPLKRNQAYQAACPLAVASKTQSSNPPLGMELRLG